MQKYQSHKVVEAGKITKFEPGPNRYSVSVEGAPEVIGLTTEVGLRIVQMMAESTDGAGDDLGYLVEYVDGYTSWSPSKAFENGYGLVQPSSGKSKIAGYRELNEGEVAAINDVKHLGVMLGEFVDIQRNDPECDQRWVSVGATHLQQGLMALTRAIAKPEFF